jgi:hypothetical protein
MLIGTSHVNHVDLHFFIFKENHFNPLVQLLSADEDCVFLKVAILLILKLLSDHDLELGSRDNFPTIRAKCFDIFWDYSILAPVFGLLRLNMEIFDRFSELRPKELALAICTFLLQFKLNLVEKNRLLICSFERPLSESSLILNLAVQS